MIARSRVVHHSGTPMPLDASSILNYLKLYDAPVDVGIFTECIIALDNIFIDKAHKRIGNAG